jgi:hypothetical protein
MSVSTTLKSVTSTTSSASPSTKPIVRNTSGWNGMPRVVLDLIFTLTAFRERLRQLELVCYHWYEASSIHGAGWRMLYLQPKWIVTAQDMSGRNGHPTVTPFNRLGQRIHRVTDVRFGSLHAQSFPMLDSIGVPVVFKEGCHRWGKSLRSISLAVGSLQSTDTLALIATQLPLLEHLDFGIAPSSLAVPLVIPQLSNNLCYLRVYSSQLSINNYGSRGHQLSVRVLGAYPQLTHFIIGHRSLLTAIDNGWQCKQLTHLLINYCQDLPTIHRILQAARGLISVAFGDVPTISDTLAILASKHSSTLSRLELRDHHLGSITALASLTQLRSLSLPPLEIDAYKQLPSLSTLTNLVTLMFTDEAIPELLSYMKALICLLPKVPQNPIDYQYSNFPRSPYVPELASAATNPYNYYY